MPAAPQSIRLPLPFLLFTETQLCRRRAIPFWTTIITLSCCGLPCFHPVPGVPFFNCCSSIPHSGLSPAVISPGWPQTFRSSAATLCLTGAMPRSSRAWRPYLYLLPEKLLWNEVSFCAVAILAVISLLLVKTPFAANREAPEAKLYLQADLAKRSSGWLRRCFFCFRCKTRLVLFPAQTRVRRRYYRIHAYFMLLALSSRV